MRRLARAGHARTHYKRSRIWPVPFGQGLGALLSLPNSHFVERGISLDAACDIPIRLAMANKEKSVNQS